MAILDVLICLKVGSSLERSDAAEQFVQNNAEGPVVAGVAEFAAIVDRLGGEVLLGADQGVHSAVRRPIDIVVVGEAHGAEEVVLVFKSANLREDLFIEYFASREID